MNNTVPGWINPTYKISKDSKEGTRVPGLDNKSSNLKFIYLATLVNKSSKYALDQ